MPNWCLNTLKVSGTEQEIKIFKEKARDKNGEVFCFENFDKLPLELEDTQSPASPVNPGEYVKRLKEYEEDKKKTGYIATRPLTHKLSKELIKKYGTNNWYDWNIAHWGTKWGAASSNLFKEGKTYLKYEFDTAWSPPMKILTTISRQFPTMKFTLKYCEDGMGFKGKAYFINGEYEDNEE